MSFAAEAWRATAPPDESAWTRLRKAGVELGPYIGCQMIGLTNIALLSDGLFELSPSGGDALITPVRCSDPIGGIETSSWLNDLIFGEVVDLVAWHPDQPESYALLTGASTTLGLIGPQLVLPPPVRIHRTILGWFQSKCDGLVVLTRDHQEQAEIYRQIDTIVAEDAEHRAEIERSASRPWPLPNVLERRSLDRVA